MKVLGFWSNSYENGVTPSFLCGDIGSDKEKIVSYLKSGARCNAWLGYARCRFECEDSETSVLGCSEMTDGKWIWPEGLYHYVEKHDLLLPSIFIDYLVSLDFNFPSIDEDLARLDLFDANDVDLKISSHEWNAWLKEMGEDDYLKSPVIVPKKVHKFDPDYDPIAMAHLMFGDDDDNQKF
ncbi:hypothetical protein EUZ85_07930 [Hahella sp. KA22]|uniref:hypothetical protein n=1 Tax=Hahella sp. KA22 TaxID=1628392 RepID=UPI000FDEB1CC|nr:hypothetical protein [Hahella sp. KA22]AZZ90649.1 hypothetical protein ENC22_05375 [Hahella sp. KA22]QAY54020.1 hypothetical protein EUZ85_07930 [Hahella sp. KA22]